MHLNSGWLKKFLHTKKKNRIYKGIRWINLVLGSVSSPPHWGLYSVSLPVCLSLLEWRLSCGSSRASPWYPTLLCPDSPGLPAHLQEDTLGWMRDHCLQTGDAFLIVFSVTDRRSFSKVPETLLRLRAGRPHHDLPVIIVGNKSDLVRSREVSVEGGHETRASMALLGNRTSPLGGHRCSRKPPSLPGACEHVSMHDA